MWRKRKSDGGSDHHRFFLRLYIIRCKNGICFRHEPPWATDWTKGRDALPACHARRHAASFRSFPPHIPPLRSRLRSRLRSLFTFPFPRVCNPRVLNMRIFNPIKNLFLLCKPATPRTDAVYKAVFFKRVWRPSYLAAAGCKPAETEADKNLFLLCRQTAPRTGAVYKAVFL